jgi:SPP1 family predicted phage head-tail adaptor
MTIPISADELREKLEVWRPTEVDDGQGGSSTELVRIGTHVRAKVSQPAAAEQIEAQQAGSTMTMIVHLRPDADVRRGDELRRADGDKLRVKYTIHPSDPVYLRADCEQIQSEGDRELP